MNLNRQTLAATIGQLFRAPDDGSGGGGGGAPANNAVTPQDARTFLSEFGHSPDALKGMQDADVVKLHGQVSASYSKRMTAEQTAAAARAKEAAKGLTLEVPKDSKLSPKDVERIAARARERGLTKEQAQAELAYEAGVLSEFEKRAIDAYNANRAKWEAAVKADPDLGGDKWTATDKNVKLAMDTFMPANVKDVAELRQVLETSGLGSHPGMVRMLNAIGAALAEDDGGASGGGQGGGKKSAEETLYGSPTQ